MMCNDSVRPINLPNRITVRIPIRARRDNRKLGRDILTDFHKVKVIFVGEDANNTL